MVTKLQYKTRKDNALMVNGKEVFGTKIAKTNDIREVSGDSCTYVFQLQKDGWKHITTDRHCDVPDNTRRADFDRFCRI